MISIDSPTIPIRMRGFSAGCFRCLTRDSVRRIEPGHAIEREGDAVEMRFLRRNLGENDRSLLEHPGMREPPEIAIASVGGGLPIG